MSHKTVSDEVIAQEMAVCKNQAEVGRRVGLTRAAISARMKDEVLQKMVEEQQASLLEVLPDTVEKVKDLIKSFKTVKQSVADKEVPLTKEEKDMAFKAMIELLKSAGALTSNSTSVFIQKITNNNNGTVLSPIIEKLIINENEKLAELANDPIEAEVEEIEDAS